MNNKKCPKHYLLVLDDGKTIEVRDVIKALYRGIKIDNLRMVSHIKWDYYANAVEYLLRAFRKDDLEKDLRKALHEIELFLEEKDD
ncbi:MAG: DUF3310 domain-containing protein [Rickettsiales bacterium]|jgi:hypothetical protein|nr:DUF3310 domain-containing protein [Rickettsiales bacterium]